MLPTHQSSASRWRGTEVPRYVGNGKLERTVEIGCVQRSAPSAGLEAGVRTLRQQDTSAAGHFGSRGRALSRISPRIRVRVSVSIVVALAPGGYSWI